MLAACDKSVPGTLMGAFSTNLPTLLMVSGPRPSLTSRVDASARVRICGAYGISVERANLRRALGELERALTLGKGTCNTMGTASTMGALAETLGLAWPGSTTIPAGDGRHLRIARHLGERAVALALTETPVTSQITPASLENALVVLCAIGGSTNAVIHLTAMAKRLGYDLSLDDIDRVAKSTPVLVDVEPSGAGLIEDFDAAGGFPSLFRALESRPQR